MHTLVEEWKYQGLSGEELENHVMWFCKASPEDKRCDIAGTYGIFDSTIKGDIFTYYFYDCDTVDYRYYGTKNWHKGVDVYKVDYDIVKDNAVVTKCKRFNKRCTENRMRMI